MVSSGSDDAPFITRQSVVKYVASTTAWILVGSAIHQAEDRDVHVPKLACHKRIFSDTVIISAKT